MILSVCTHSKKWGGREPGEEEENSLRSGKDKEMRNRSKGTDAKVNMKRKEG